APHLLELGTVALVLCTLAFAGEGPLSLLAPVIYAAVVFVFAFEGGALSSLLRTAPFRCLGRWSYSIYLDQGIVFSLLMRVTAFAAPLLGLALREEWTARADELDFMLIGNAWVLDGLALLFLLLVTLAAAITYRYIEQPGRGLFNRFAQQHAQTRAR